MTTANKTVAEMMTVADSDIDTIRRIRVLDAQANYRVCVSRGYDLASAERELRAAWTACPEHGSRRAA